MDAVRKWILAGEDAIADLLKEAKTNPGSMQEGLDHIKAIAHLRTVPEGYALVPVPEWVPVDGRALPGLMRGGDYWIVRGARVYLGGTIDLRDPDATHYQIALPPAPPKSEPL